MRARVRLEPHDTLWDLTTLTFSDGDGSTFEIHLNPESLAMLAGRMGERLAQLEAETPSAVRAV